MIPISFNHFNYGRTGSVNRRCICDFHSANTLTIEAVTCPPDLLAHAVILQAIECGKCLQVCPPPPLSLSLPPLGLVAPNPFFLVVVLFRDAEREWPRTRPGFRGC